MSGHIHRCGHECSCAQPEEFACPAGASEVGQTGGSGMTPITSSQRMPEMKISVAQAAKIGSIFVHVEEAMSSNGHNFDVHAVQSLMVDPDVTGWLAHLRGMALLPVKR